MLSLLKIDPTPEIETYLYQKYFEPQLRLIAATYQWTTALFPPSSSLIKSKPPKKVDLMRLQHMEEHIDKQKEHMFEFQMMAILAKKTKTTTKAVLTAQEIYTLLHIRKATIPHVNQHVMLFVETFLKHIRQNQESCWIQQVFHDAYHVLEKKPHLLSYEDMTLYDHQKKLFFSMVSSVAFFPYTTMV